MRWLHFIVLMLATNTAFAKPNYCDDITKPNPTSYGAVAIQRVVEHVAKLTSQVDPVPPADMDFFDREMQAALGYEGRFDLLQTYPHFYAWQVWTSRKRVSDALTKAQAADSMEQRALHVLQALTELDDLQANLYDFYRYDSRRTTRMIQDKKGFWRWGPAIEWELKHIIECAIITKS